MVEVRVCVGSSCHVRGGTETLMKMQAMIQDAKLVDKVDLKADLCLDNCLEAPNVVVNGQIHGGVTPDKVCDFFNGEVLPLIKAGG
jgi:NADH:ubiquinone oxidoreductase subunit E